MTEEQKKEQIARDEGDVEGQSLSATADSLATDATRVPKEGDDVEGQALVFETQAISPRTPDEEDDVEGHRIDGGHGRFDTGKNKLDPD